MPARRGAAIGLAVWACMLLVPLVSAADPVPGRGAVPATRAAVPPPPPGDSSEHARSQPPSRAAVPAAALARTSIPSRGPRLALAVVRAARRFLGRPYQWSGIGDRGFDCSGLVFRVFAMVGRVVPHSSFAQYHAGKPVPARALRPGDLVFFRTYSAGPSHVGIYVGASRFIHASPSRGVTISSMREPYFRSRYLGARRL